MTLTGHARCHDHIIRFLGRPCSRGKLFSLLERVQAQKQAYPYGSVGALNTPANPRGIPFGSTYQDHLQLSTAIKTYSEQIDDADELDQIRKMVRDADSLIFLGFAFHEQNIRLIKPKGDPTLKSVFGTAFGMSESDVQVVKREINTFALGHGTLTTQLERMQIENNLKCSELFEQFAKSLPS